MIQNRILVQTILILLRMKALQQKLPRKPTKLITGTRAVKETVSKISVTNMNPTQVPITPTTAAVLMTTRTRAVPKTVTRNLMKLLDKHLLL